MRRKVVIIGGGVAGLTAAHELIERGFDVLVVERRSRYGGKASSVTTQNGFSGEHGFRFFPGWYRHVTDTMARIPYKGRYVADNLVTASQNLFASYHRDPVVALLRFPTSIADVASLAAVPENVLKLGLTAADFLFFFRKLAEFAAAPEAQRLAKYETLTWWQFMDADARSKEFQSYLVDGITRNTVAAEPRQANAYTIATVALRTLMDAVRPDSPVDRVLNGPTNKVWIDPWVEHLKARGVAFHDDAELESIEFGDGPEVRAVRIRRHGMKLRCCEAHHRLLHAQRTRWQLLGFAPSQAAPGGDDMETNRRTNADRLKQVEEELQRPSLWELAGRAGWTARRAGWTASPFIGSGWSDKTASTMADEAELRALDEELSKVSADLKKLTEMADTESVEVAADYFVFALPVEQMAYYVKRSETLRRHDESLSRLLTLSAHVEWMSGIQFYLTETLEITSGHIDCIDSEWALTAICQTQFWTEEDVEKQGVGNLKGQVKTILSVDISAWNVKGKLLRKEAYACTREEIAAEVWHQLTASLNRRGRAPVLRDDYLLEFRGNGIPEESYHLDDDIVDRFDRKKQALYKTFESVQFSQEAVATARSNGATERTLFAHGDRLKVNVEPLLVNRVNTWQLRPEPTTAISNLFLAADYVRTHTNLATMEAANEAARAAVNALLLVSGSDQPPCRIWTLNPPVDALMTFGRFFGLSKPAGDGSLGASAEVFAHAAAKATQASRGFAQAFSNMMRKR